MNIRLSERGILPHPETVQTAAIQAAIDECAESGGGTVYFDAGIYRTGTLWLRSNTYLNLPPCCRVKGSDSFDDYNASDAFEQNPYSVPEHQNGKHLILAVEVENCGIFGGGILDGNGLHFGYRNEPGFFRPGQMVCLIESKNIRLENLQLLNSPYWSCFVHGCEDVFISGLLIRNNRSIPNSDGIDLDCSRRVVISNCIIDTQDDSITFRGSIKRLKDKSKVLEDVSVTNCQIRTDCNAFRIGVGSNPIRNCTVSNTVIRDSSKGVCMEARYLFNTDENPGTSIENITFSNCYFDCRLPIFISSYCRGIEPNIAPRIRNIRFTGLTIASDHNIVVQAKPDSVIENITFADIQMDCRGVPECEDKYGYGEWDYVTAPAALWTSHVRNLNLRNVNFHVEEKDSPIACGIISYASDLHMDQVAAERADEAIPVLEERGAPTAFA